MLGRVIRDVNRTFLGILTTLADEDRKCWSLKEGGRESELRPLEI